MNNTKKIVAVIIAAGLIVFAVVWLTRGDKTSAPEAITAPGINTQEQNTESNPVLPESLPGTSDDGRTDGLPG